MRSGTHLGRVVLALGSLLGFSAIGSMAQHGRADQHHVASAHHDFSDAERWAKVFEAEDRDEWQMPDHLVALMEIRSGMTIADLGAGTGYFLAYLQAAVGGEGKVLALDTEPELVDYIKRRAESRGWKGVEARTIPFDDPTISTGTVDRVLIVDTWHHIENREIYSRRLKDALADEGRVMIVDFTMQSPYGPPAKHRLPAEQVRRELEAGGLTAEIIDENLPHQFAVVGWKSSAIR